jgi:hypothetical protein
MKVLVACEESQTVTKAFRALGHEAFSCDLQECSGGHPEWHLQQDAYHVSHWNEFKWDLMIAHPPCTHLAVSGARWFKDKQKEQEQAFLFFMSLATAPIPHICLENPISIISTKWQKPNQIIQPWQFGHGEVKSTCLWLKNLPLLVPTNIVDGREQKIWRMPPSPDRAKLRSKTYPGIADAMATQWSEFLAKQKAA